MLSRIFSWLGVEANARALMILLSVGTAIGASTYFVADRILPLVSPELGSTKFAEGYRRGQREATLEFELKATLATLEAERRMAEVANKYCSMTEKEREEYVLKRLRESTF